jgi:hypothetical protein
MLSSCKFPFSRSNIPNEGTRSGQPPFVRCQHSFVRAHTSALLSDVRKALMVVEETPEKARRDVYVICDQVQVAEPRHTCIRRYNAVSYCNLSITRCVLMSTSLLKISPNPSHPTDHSSIFWPLHFYKSSTGDQNSDHRTMMAACILCSFTIYSYLV